MKRNLPTIQQDSLARVKSNLEVLNKLVKSQKTIIDTKLRKRLIELMVRHKGFFLTMVSHIYPLSEVLLLKFKEKWVYDNDDYYNRKGIMFNKKIRLNTNLVFKLKDNIDWKCLLGFGEINWSPEFIIKCQKYIIDAAEEINWSERYGFYSTEMIYKIIVDSCDWNESVLKKNIHILPWEIVKHSIQFNEVLFSTGLFPERINWTSLSRSLSLGSKLLTEYPNKLNWKELCSYNTSVLSAQVISENLDKIDFSSLSKHIKDIDLIRTFESNWNWKNLSGNRNMPWSKEVIREYKARWNWVFLSMSKDIPWTLDLICEFEEYWYWPGLSSNESLPWSNELMIRFVDKWDLKKWEYDYDFDPYYPTIENSKITWTLDCIKAFEHRYIWNIISHCENIDWSNEFIDKYKEKWSWYPLSSNKALPWSKELLYRYSDKWKWRDLSRNPSLPWSYAFIEEFKDNWDWSQLSMNEGLPWTQEFINEYYDLWDFKNLGYNKSIPWSRGLIIRLENKIDFESLSNNQSIPFDYKLIDMFKNRWRWSDPRYICLSNNKSVTWSFDLLEKFEDKWDWNQICSGNLTVWDEVIAPLLDDNIVEEIMESIVNKNKHSD